MTVRTTYRTLSFAHHFQLKDMDQARPAGAYVVETDEELLQELSFSAWRRVASRLLLPIGPGGPMLSEVIDIDPMELDAALERDAAA
jgi:hypothetical protein